MKSIVLLVAAITVTGIARADDVQYDIRVDGITCPFCVATSERAMPATVIAATNRTIDFIAAPRFFKN